jgi:alpha-glucosidase (family GH31 glycosyl hydrolase)
MSHRYTFPRQPRADPKAIVGGAKCQYRFTVLESSLIRYEWASDGKFEDRASVFALNRLRTVPDFRLIEHDHSLEIITDSLHLRYDKGPFNASGLTCELGGKFSTYGSLWRYGEPSQDLGGTARTLDNMNGRIPLGGGVVSKAGYSTIDDSKSMLFGDNGWIASRRPGEDRIDGYLFAYGHDYRAAIKAFYAISGKQPLLPRWSLGNWWSRYYPYSADEYLGLMDRFKSEGLPFSVGTLDMDWHLVHDKRVTGSGWTGYTWNRKLFPNPKGFLKEMHKRNLQVPLNDHPAGGVRSYEDQYKDMGNAIGHDTSKGEPILFDITNRRFCDAFFDILHRNLEDQGVDFWWIDWQQGTHSRMPNIDPLQVLNHYHFLDNGHNGRRPLILSRFGGPGSHRYPVGFSGDVHITWESLDFQPEFTATASNIGYGWWSHDIGGHMLGYRDEELSTRWLQFGVFSPIMRLHSTFDPFITKEPWTFGVEARGIMDKFLRYRHRLMPYLYSMNMLSARDGEPLIRPLYWYYPEAPAAYRHLNEYFFGSELLVIPITSPADIKTRLGSVQGWIPPRRHVDIFTGIVYDGNRELWLNRPLSKYPVLAREGSIIPLDAASELQNGCPNPTAFEIHIVVGADAVFEILEDDGTGARLEEARIAKTIITFTQTTGVVKITHSSPKSTFLPAKRNWTLKFLACHAPHFRMPVTISTAGQSQLQNIIEVEMKDGSSILSLGSVPTNSEVTILVGKNPQLNVTDVEKHIHPVINNAQIEFEMKRDAWNIVMAKIPLSVKIGMLCALSLQEKMLNALLEVLVADSRSQAPLQVLTERNEAATT